MNGAQTRRGFLKRASLTAGGFLAVGMEAGLRPVAAVRANSMEFRETISQTVVCRKRQGVRECEEVVGGRFTLLARVSLGEIKVDEINETSLFRVRLDEFLVEGVVGDDLRYDGIRRIARIHFPGAGPHGRPLARATSVVLTWDEAEVNFRVTGRLSDTEAGLIGDQFLGRPSKTVGGVTQGQVEFDQIVRSFQVSYNGRVVSALRVVDATEYVNSRVEVSGASLA